MRSAPSFTRWSAVLFLAVLAVLSGPAPAAASETTWSPVPIHGGIVANVGAGGSGDSLVAWATTAAAGVYRSTDGGRTWAPVRQAPSPRASLAGVDPRDGNRVFVMYLRPEFGPNAPTGLFFTEDGGATWTRSREGLPAQVFVYQVAFDPQDEDVLFAGTSGGLYRSDDGGRTWSPTSSLHGYVFAVAVAPDDPKILLVSTLDKVYRSADGGATFTEVLGSGLYNDLVFDPSDPDRVYGTFGTLYRSTDRGLTWEQIGQPFALGIIAVDQDGTIYAGSELGVVRSTDGGTTFSEPRRRPDDVILDLVALSNGDVLASGRRGVWRLPDGEQAWQASSRGIRAHDIAGVAVTASGRVLVSVPWNGVFRSDNGTSFRLSFRGLRKNLEVPGLELVPAPSDPKVVYGSDALQFFRSDDGGVTWKELTVPAAGRAVRIVAVDPRNPEIVYAGGPEYNPRDDIGKCHALRSSNRGETWTCLEGTDIYSLGSVEIDSRRPSRLFALDGNLIKVSDDRGDTWRPVGNGTTIPEPVSDALARDARGRFFTVAYTGRVYRSTDGGATFAPVGTLLPDAIVLDLIADPRRANTLYALVDRQGIFRSQNGGRTWQRLGTGLPTALFRGVAALDTERGILWAGTQGRGLYRIDVP